MNQEEKPRLSRLTAILTMLQSKRLLTAREIANKHGVSIRTIYRDIRALEESGIPIITEEGRGYSIMEGYHLPPVMFTENEANAIITAQQLISRNKDQSLSDEFDNVVTKIQSILRNGQKEKTELVSDRVFIRNNQSNKKTSTYLMTIQNALTSYHLISIEYLSLAEKKSKRIVEPFALYSTQENWLLIAYCRLRNDFRAFRLDRIQKLIVQDELFAPHKISLQEYFELCNEKQKTTPDIPLT